MTDPHLWKKFKLMESCLANAKRHLLLANPGTGSLDADALKRFDEYLLHNEFGLALQEMEDLGNDNPCRGAFWCSLEDAAKLMELTDKAAQFHAAFLLAARKIPD